MCMIGGGRGRSGTGAAGSSWLSSTTSRGSSPYLHSDGHSLCLTQDVLAQNVPMNRMPSGVRRRELRGAEKRTKGCGEEN